MKDGPRDASPLHTDQDWGLTLFIFWQERRCPAKHAAVFKIGNASYKILGGAVFMLHAKFLKHGLQMPIQPKPDVYPWHGIAVVKMKR